MIYELLFPQLADKKWEPINLNEFSEITHWFHPEINFLDPDQMDNWLTGVHRDLGCDHTFGGYLEDRQHIWKESYIEFDSAIHLGIDFNVSAGTMVYSPVAGKVVHTMYDPKDFGWGTRVILKVREDLYVVLAHLHPYLNVELGEEVAKGALLGVVAPHEHNGGWYEHLHIQLLTEWSSDFDGYASRTEDLERKFPNPELILGETHGRE